VTRSLVRGVGRLVGDIGATGGSCRSHGDRGRVVAKQVVGPGLQGEGHTRRQASQFTMLPSPASPSSPPPPSPSSSASLSYHHHGISFSPLPPPSTHIDGHIDRARGVQAGWRIQEEVLDGGDADGKQAPGGWRGEGRPIDGPAGKGRRGSRERERGSPTAGGHTSGVPAVQGERLQQSQRPPHVSFKESLSCTIYYRCIAPSVYTPGAGQGGRVGWGARGGGRARLLGRSRRRSTIQITPHSCTDPPRRPEWCRSNCQRPCCSPPGVGPGRCSCPERPGRLGDWCKGWGCRGSAVWGGTNAFGWVRLVIDSAVHLRLPHSLRCRRRGRWSHNWSQTQLPLCKRRTDRTYPRIGSRTTSGCKS
jgi:hypothetical protein